MSHHRLVRPGVLIALVLLLAPLPGPTSAAGAADPPGGEPDGIAAQLDAIRGELQSIAALLGKVEQHQRVTALMTRIRLKQQRTSSIEGELRTARTDQEAARQEIDRMTAIEESWTSGQDHAGLDQATLTEDERRNLELMRREKQSLTERVETLRLRIVELENDLARGQREVQGLEETVDELLGLR